ncbi:MAG: hypothetical protein ABIG31_00520 [Candidatus Omnitrophota bacterium]
MTTRKCDSCKKILEKEPYYSIGEIDYTVPGASFSRLVVYKGKNFRTKETRKESWVNYADLDFCEACWKKLEFMKWVKK